jgi:hypothetical protein
MLKHLINLSLITIALLVSLENAGYTQPLSIATKPEQSITQINNLTSVPSFITEGFNKLCHKQFSIKDAINLFVDHSNPELRKEINPQQIDTMSGVLEGFLGECKGYSVMGSVFLADEIQILFISTEHVRGRLFWEFVLQRSATDWNMVSFKSNTNFNELINILN